MTIESHHWVVLAKDRDPIARGRLVNDLARTVLASELGDGPERAIFFDIVRRLLAGLSREDRRRFADLAADRSPLPRDVLMRLARDDSRVAEPILHRAVDLLEDDLADIAGRFGLGHRLAIAMRAAVSPRIVRILLNRGGREVLIGLGANPGAALDDDDLRELSRHAEAEADADLRQALLAREGAPGPSPRASRPSGEPVPAVDGPQAPRRKPTPSRPLVEALVASVRDETRTLESVVAELADADRHADLACLLGRLARIEEAVVMRVLVRADVDGIAMLAGGLSLDAAAFDRLVELRRRKLRFSTSQAGWERDAYRDVDRIQARSTLDALGRGRRVA